MLDWWSDKVRTPPKSLPDPSFRIPWKKSEAVFAWKPTTFQHSRSLNTHVFRYRRYNYFYRDKLQNERVSSISGQQRLTPPNPIHRFP